MSAIVTRIEKYLSLSKISTRQFEIAIGISNGAISRAILKKTDIQSKWLSKIIDTYPNINPNWLLTGEGSMIKNTSRHYDVSEKANLAVNEEESSYLHSPKSLFNKLKSTRLTENQIKLLDTIESNYYILLDERIGIQNKIIQLYENKGQ